MTVDKKMEEEIVNKFQRGLTLSVKESLYLFNKYIESLEQQPSEDCISRESVRQLICKNNDKYGYSDRFHEFTEECLQLPSVTPQRPKGKWSRPSVVAMPYSFAYECPICRQWGNIQTFKPNYCPNCGAKMEVEE